MPPKADAPGARLVFSLQPNEGTGKCNFTGEFSFATPPIAYADSFVKSTCPQRPMLLAPDCWLLYFQMREQGTVPSLSKFTHSSLTSQWSRECFMAAHLIICIPREPNCYGVPAFDAIAQDVVDLKRDSKLKAFRDQIFSVRCSGGCASQRSTPQAEPVDPSICASKLGKGLMTGARRAANSDG